MAISLSKGGNISLAKEAPGLTKVLAGLGWDVRSTSGEQFDLDASAILLDSNGKVRSDKDFVYYNQKCHESGSVVHQGDNRTGEGDGDDEVIEIDLSRVPTDVERIVIAVSIYQADERRQNFGMVRNAYVRLLDAVSGAEVVRYDLSEDASTETALNFAELYRDNNGVGWKFRAIGQGYNSGLGGIARDFGVNV